MDPTSFVQRQHIILGFFQSVTRLMTFTLEELFFLSLNYFQAQPSLQPYAPPLAAAIEPPVVAIAAAFRKVKVRVNDRLLLIPLPDPDRTVQWLRGTCSVFINTG